MEEKKQTGRAENDESKEAAKNEEKERRKRGVVQSGRKIERERQSL